MAFDRGVKLGFHGSQVTSDAGLLACRELDEALSATRTSKTHFDTMNLKPKGKFRVRMNLSLHDVSSFIPQLVKKQGGSSPICVKPGTNFVNSPVVRALSATVRSALGLGCVLGCFLVSAAFAYQTNNITLTFDCDATNLGTRIPDNFVGLSLSRKFINGANGSAQPFNPSWNPGTSRTTYQQFTNLLGQVGIRHWRTICGYSGGAPDPTPAQDNQFFATLAASGVTNVIYSLHCFCESDSSDNIAAATNILLNPTAAAMLESFALDNEPNFNIFQQCPTDKWTEPEYAAQWSMVYTQTENGIAAAGLPWAPFSGPDNGSVLPPNPGTNTPQSWILLFATDAASKPFYSMATQHDYDSNCGPTSPNATQMARTNLSPDRVASWNQVFTSLLWGAPAWPNDWHGNKLRYRLTEASAFNNGGGTGAPNGNTNGQTFSTALWELDFCHWWAQRGCAGVNPHNRPVNYNAPIQLNWSSGVWTAMPYAYGLKAFDMGGHGYPITNTTAFFSNPDGINVTAYGVLSPDHRHLYVTVINKTFDAVGAHAANVTIPAPGNFSTPTNAQYLLLSSTPDGQDGNATNLQTAYLGGATIPNIGQWNGTWSPLTLNSQRQVNIVVQPATGVVIDLQGGSSQATNAELPVIVQDLPARITLATGSSYTYSPEVNGAQPLSYQWYNATNPVGGETNATFTVTAGNPGSSTTYHVIITNIFGAATSSVSALEAVPPLTNSYATTLLGFHPVGYWPMHEEETAAPGDIETNYGSLGALGNGYYGDWTGLNGWVQHNMPGALAGDTNPAVFFSFPVTGAVGSATNCLIVPNASPQATLVPPFTVELWYFYTNATASGKQGDIWCQGGSKGLNGSSLLCGIRLNENGNFSLYTYNNNSGTHTPGTGTLLYGASAQWMHLVVTDDGTNINLYTNGVVCISNWPNANYAPDYWDPLTIASGKGFTRNAGGEVDEFAVYTNALSTDDIALHYAAGVNSNPAIPYKTLVLKDHPVIYFRMDSPAYSPPAADPLPELINYGSAGVSGVYSPGTLPGIAAGPANSNGVPYGGLSGAKAVQFSGVSSFANAGYAPTFDPTGAVPFTVTAMFRGNPCDSRLQTIIGHSDDSWRIAINTSGQLQCALGTDVNSVVNSTGVYNDGNWHQVVDVYSPASVSTETGTNILYVDGVLDASVSTVSSNGIEPGALLDVMIGADPQYTNDPVAIGRQFAGQVCEVALFTNALTAAQVQEIYHAAVFITPTINVKPAEGGLVITYVGTLLSATNVAGPYSPVNGATSPYTIPMTNTQQFYRTENAEGY